jgi:hypothetical protein
MPQRPPPPKRPTSIDPPWKYPQASIAMDLLAFVMGSDERGVFKPRPDDGAPEPDVAYRATVFWTAKVEGDTEPRLYPFLRARLGGAVKECTSAIYFRKGEAFAGKAWNELEPLHTPPLPTLAADCHGDELVWRRAWQELGVPERITEAMGLDSAYATKVAALACVGVKSAYGPIVLCIDSVRPDAFDNKWLRPFASGIYGNVGNLLVVIQKRVRGHRDFWAWILKEYKQWRVPIGLAPGLSWLGSGTIAAVARADSPVAFVQSYFVHYWRWASLATVLGLGLFLPQQRHASGPQVNTGRLATFARRWRNAWLFIVLAQAAAALTTLSVLDEKRLLPVIGALATLVAASNVLGCYFCLTRFASPDLPIDELIAVPTGVLMLIIVLGLIAVAFCSNPFLVDCPASILLAVALGLLAGRLDSRLIGTPGIVTAALYLNAVLRPVCCILASAGEFLYPGQPDRALPIGVWSNLARMPLDVLMFIVVLWSVNGRAIERYLTNIERVALAVPRQTFGEAWKKRRQV